MSGENRVKLSERIYERAKALWPRYLTHPFVTEMADGTLPMEKFRYYMLQDYLYLKDYVKIHTDEEPHPVLSLTSLKTLEEQLPADRFIRVHRSYIVNLRAIRSYVRGRIFLSDTEYVPIGENYKEAFQNYIDRHFKNL